MNKIIPNEIYDILSPMNMSSPVVIGNKTYSCPVTYHYSQKTIIPVERESIEKAPANNLAEWKKRHDYAKARPGWLETESRIAMETGVRYFLSARPEMLEALKKTENLPLRFVFGSNSEWGIGNDGNGKNIYGSIMDKIRMDIWKGKNPSSPEVMPRNKEGVSDIYTVAFFNMDISKNNWMNFYKNEMKERLNIFNIENNISPTAISVNERITDNFIHLFFQIKGRVDVTLLLQNINAIGGTTWIEEQNESELIVKNTREFHTISEKESTIVTFTEYAKKGGKPTFYKNKIRNMDEYKKDVKIITETKEETVKKSEKPREISLMQLRNELMDTIAENRFKNHQNNETYNNETNKQSENNPVDKTLLQIPNKKRLVAQLNEIVGECKNKKKQEETSKKKPEEKVKTVIENAKETEEPTSGKSTLNVSHKQATLFSDIPDSSNESDDSIKKRKSGQKKKISVFNNKLSPEASKMLEHDMSR